MAGKYYLNESIELTSEDNNLVIQNYNDEQAIVSGALNLEANWKLYKDGIYQTDLLFPTATRVGESRHESDAAYTHLTALTTGSHRRSMPIMAPLLV